MKNLLAISHVGLHEELHDE